MRVPAGLPAAHPWPSWYSQAAAAGSTAALHLFVFPAGLSAAHPGLAKLMFSALFPVGLMVTILHGVELYTGDHAMQLRLVVIHLNSVFCRESAAATVTVLAKAAAGVKFMRAS